MGKAKHRKPEVIEAEISKLQYELAKSQMHYGIIPLELDLELRIPNQFKRHFPGQEYYDSYMQKLVWEEDD